MIKEEFCVAKRFRLNPPVRFDMADHLTDYARPDKRAPGELDTTDIISFIHYQYTSGSTNHREIERMKRMISFAVNNELTERQRQCIILFYLRGMKMKEIAKKLCLSPSTVSRHISVARQKLRKLRNYI
jgi:RNA polymerase sigma factor (sigma-70 family)